MFLLVECLLTILNRSTNCLSEVGVLVHNVVEVGDLPVERSLVISRGNLNQVRPSQVGFETHHILHCIRVSATEQYLRVVLVLDVHFHGGLDKSSDSH